MAGDLILILVPIDWKHGIPPRPDHPAEVAVGLLMSLVTGRHGRLMLEPPWAGYFARFGPYI